MNPTSIHEDMGSIPGLPQWVEASCSIVDRCFSDPACCCGCSSDSTVGVALKKKEKNKTKNRIKYIYMFVSDTGKCSGGGNMKRRGRGNSKAD